MAGSAAWRRRWRGSGVGEDGGFTGGSGGVSLILLLRISDAGAAGADDDVVGPLDADEAGAVGVVGASVVGASDDGGSEVGSLDGGSDVGSASR